MQDKQDERRRWRQWLLALIGPCVVASSTVAGQSTGQTDEAKVLAVPISPGAVARLVAYPNSAAAVNRLSEAVTHPRPDVRAAAARVIFVVRQSGLLPRVASALEQEADADALFEQSRVLAHLGGPSYDARVLAAAERTGSFHITLAIAAARGPEALDLLPSIATNSPRGRLVAVNFTLN